MIASNWLFFVLNWSESCKSQDLRMSIEQTINNFEIDEFQVDFKQIIINNKCIKMYPDFKTLKLLLKVILNIVFSWNFIN